MTRSEFLLPLEFIYDFERVIRKNSADKAEKLICHRVPRSVLDDLEMAPDASGNPYARLLRAQPGAPLPWAEYYSSDPRLVTALRAWYLSVGEEGEKECPVAPWRSFADCGMEVDDFCYKYGLFGWSHTAFLNKYSTAIQLSNLYSLAAPAIQLVLPFIMLVIPFLVIKFALRLPLTFSHYKALLMTQLKRHSLGQVFSVFDSDKTLQQRGTALAILGFYLYSIYQNAMSCVKHASTIRKVNEFLRDAQRIVSRSLEGQRRMIGELEGAAGGLDSLAPYIGFLGDRRAAAESLLGRLERNEAAVGGRPSLNATSVWAIGDSLQLFHELYTDPSLRRVMEHCVGALRFEQDCISLCAREKEGVLARCEFVEGEGYVGNEGKEKKENNKEESQKETRMRGMYYPFMLDEGGSVPADAVRNDFCLARGEKTRFVTGPNASGKTTYIKTTLINLIFSQQLGMGFYESASVKPYHVFHSYLTIPDTSGRDSLFQAEARRCLDIMRSAEAGGGRERHFAIFDELFSGTNSVEAVDIAQVYLEDMSERSFHAIVTTHFSDLVKRCVGKKGERKSGPRKFTSYRMAVSATPPRESGGGDKDGEGDGDGGGDTGAFTFEYRVERGLNRVRGAVRVLRGLEYPARVLDKLSFK
jgi:hypothetical protein